MDDFLARDLVGLGLEGGDHTMPENVGGNLLHVLWGDVRAATEESVRLRSEREIDRSPRACSKANHPIHLRHEPRRLTSREDEADDVVLDLLIHVDEVHQL